MTEMLLQPKSDAMPVEIRRAVGALWLSLLIAIIAAIIDWRHVHRENAAFSVVVQICTCGFFGLLIWKVGQGRNWARITWLLLFVIGCSLTVASALSSETYRNQVVGTLFRAIVVVVQTGIQLYAAVLLFSPRGRTWFLRKQ